MMPPRLGAEQLAREATTPGRPTSSRTCAGASPSASFSDPGWGRRSLGSSTASLGWPTRRVVAHRIGFLRLPTCGAFATTAQCENIRVCRSATCKIIRLASIHRISASNEGSYPVRSISE